MLDSRTKCLKKMLTLSTTKLLLNIILERETSFKQER